MNALVAIARLFQRGGAERMLSGDIKKGARPVGVAGHERARELRDGVADIDEMRVIARGLNIDYKDRRRVAGFNMAAQIVPSRIASACGARPRAHEPFRQSALGWRRYQGLIKKLR